MHSSFKPLSADTLHRIREALEAVDRPSTVVADQVAHAINSAETSQQDAAKSGFVRVSGTDMLELVERMRRERMQVDASRRSVETSKKKSQLRADQPEGFSDEYVREQLHGWMNQQTAIQNKGAGLIALSEIATLVGNSVTELAEWVRAEKINLTPNLPDFSRRGGGLWDRMQAKVEAA